jgi:hypothetical protein
MVLVNKPLNNTNMKNILDKVAHFKDSIFGYQDSVSRRLNLKDLQNGKDVWIMLSVLTSHPFYIYSYVLWCAVSFSFLCHG